TRNTSSELNSIALAIACPCVGPSSSVRRISKSSVPCSKSIRSFSALVDILGDDTLAPVECQGEEPAICSTRGLLINAPTQYLHVRIRIRRRAKTELLVESMSIPRVQRKAAKVLQIGMGTNRFHQPLAQAKLSIFLQNIDIREIGKNRLICNDPGESNLTIALKHPEANRTR